LKELETIKQKITDFYSIETEEEKTAVIATIRKISENSNREEFINYIRNNFKQKPLSGIGVIYEALSAYPKEWGSFYLSEIKRAFKAATISLESFQILDGIEEISMVDASQVRERKQIIEFLSGYLNSNNDVLKYKTIWILGDWLDKKEKMNYPKIVNQIKNCLNDPNWRIRVCSYYTLHDLESLPKNYQINFKDKLRMKIFNQFKM